MAGNLKKKSKKNDRQKPIPLAPPPMKSRKRARIVTTLFHKYTRERDEAVEVGDTEKVATLERQIIEIGGREEYQRASQLNTSIFSTSKWVLSILHKQKWLPSGIEISPEGIGESDAESKLSKEKARRRPIRLLEVGAINAELLDASNNPKYSLTVRAIDIQSSKEERIEEKDFLQLDLVDAGNPQNRYDAIVCSMVINCVTTPKDRGLMLFLLKRHLRPGGLCFITLPLLCLTQSPYVTKDTFKNILSNVIGFEILETKETPKIAFYVVRRSMKDVSDEPYNEFVSSLDPRWHSITTIMRGKKYRNKFAIVFKG